MYLITYIKYIYHIYTFDNGHYPSKFLLLKRVISRLTIHVTIQKMYVKMWHRYVLHSKSESIG